MFSISQLAGLVSTGIGISLFLIALVAAVGGATSTSIAVHSKRSSKKQKIEKAKEKSVAKTKTNEKTTEKTKTQVKTANKTKTQAKTVDKTKSLKNQQEQTTVKKSAPVKTTSQLLEKPVVDKSKLIGDENVSDADFNDDSKFKWVYRLKLISDKKPENSEVLTFKSSDNSSAFDALRQDIKLVDYDITNCDINHSEIDFKYADSNGKPLNYNKKYEISDDFSSAKIFRYEKNNMLSFVSIQQSLNAKNTKPNKQNDDEQVL